jgi:hypothetical protein
MRAGSLFLAALGVILNVSVSGAAEAGLSGEALAARDGFHWTSAGWTRPGDPTPYRWSPSGWVRVGNEPARREPGVGNYAQDHPEEDARARQAGPYGDFSGMQKIDPRQMARDPRQFGIDPRQLENTRMDAVTTKAAENYTLRDVLHEIDQAYPFVGQNQERVLARAKALREWLANKAMIEAAGAGSR